MDCNKVILVGRVGKDPVSGVTSKNNKKAFLSIATHRFNPRATTEAEKEITEWHDVVFFTERAERVLQTVKQGMLLRVEGSLHYYNIKNETGLIRKSEIWGVDFGLVGKDEIVKVEVTQTVKPVESKVDPAEVTRNLATVVAEFKPDLESTTTPKTFAQILEEEENA